MVNGLLLNSGPAMAHNHGGNTVGCVLPHSIRRRCRPVFAAREVAARIS